MQITIDDSKFKHLNVDEETIEIIAQNHIANYMRKLETKLIDDEAKRIDKLRHEAFISNGYRGFKFYDFYKGETPYFNAYKRENKKKHTLYIGKDLNLAKIKIDNYILKLQEGGK